jgi:hypothetical protein
MARIVIEHDKGNGAHVCKHEPSIEKKMLLAWENLKNYSELKTYVTCHLKQSR